MKKNNKTPFKEDLKMANELKETLVNDVNKEIVETAAEEIVNEGTGKWLTGLGIAGGVVLVGAAIYFGVKKIRNKKNQKEDVIDAEEFTVEDVEETEEENSGAETK